MCSLNRLLGLKLVRKSTIKGNQAALLELHILVTIQTKEVDCMNTAYINQEQVQQFYLLVAAMDRTGWIKTTIHNPGQIPEDHDYRLDEYALAVEQPSLIPYIYFYCQINKVDYLCMLLDNALRAISTFGLEFEGVDAYLRVIYDSVDLNPQGGAPAGCLSLKLEIRGTVALACDSKAEVFSVFKNVFMSATKVFVE